MILKRVITRSAAVLLSTLSAGGWAVRSATGTSITSTGPGSTNIITSSWNNSFSLMNQNMVNIGNFTGHSLNWQCQRKR